MEAAKLATALTHCWSIAHSVEEVKRRILRLVSESRTAAMHKEMQQGVLLTVMGLALWQGCKGMSHHTVLVVT